MKNFVLFGASGDLARKKIYPAIFQNYKDGFRCKYVGYGRTSISDIDFRKIVSESTKTDDINFLSQFSYIQGSYDREGLEKLRDLVDQENIFYLSIPNRLEIVEEIVYGLKSNELLNKKSQIVIEKPFGQDYQSAKELINILHTDIEEANIFPIDHYLAKDLVRNLITLRFANPIFENIWNNKNIEKIDINIFEKDGIGSRGQYYDNTGAIKDMIQNHGLQLLALVTMNQPSSFKSEYFHKEKELILNDLRILDNDFNPNIKIGQYEGYLNEEYVSKDSKTETYASIRFEVNSDRWNGVPINITTGKRLEKKHTEIKIYFRSLDDCLWKDHCNTVTRNILTINIFPENNIRLSINTEFNPDVNLPDKKELVFGFDHTDSIDLPYSNALKDIYSNEKSYTPSFEEILLSWKLIDRIEDWIDNNRDNILEIYE